MLLYAAELRHTAHTGITAELDSAGALLRVYSHYAGVDAPHAVQVRTGPRADTYFYAQEAPGHAAGVFGGANNVVDEYRYSAFGTVQPGTREELPQPLRYMGRELDAGTGLYQVRARWYDAELERFVSEDPIGLAGGVNAYAYAGNDPVNLTDPSGLAPGDCPWGGDRYWCEGITVIGWRNGDGPFGTSLLFGIRAGDMSEEWSTQCGETRNSRKCKITWSDADHPNRSVRPGVMEEVQALANKAHVDLTLSSGLRRGPCYLTSVDGRGSMHNCGLAVDISAINGVDIGRGRTTNPAASGLIELVMGTAKTMVNVRENLGPLGLWKAANYGDRQTRFYNIATQNIHYNHIHIGVHPIERRRGP